MRVRSVIVVLTACGIVLVAASIAMGARVAAHPGDAFDRFGGRARGHGLGLARFFTRLGRWYGIVGAIYGAFIVTANARASVVPVLVIALAQILSQATSAFVKLAFRRARPSTSIGSHEPDFSYPSGHSVTAVVLYAGLAILATQLPVPVPAGALLSILLVGLAIGITWSRLALAAHYATDVAGGLILGAGWLCLAFAALDRWVPSWSR